MKKNLLFTTLVLALLCSCNPDTKKDNNDSETTTDDKETSSGSRRYAGPISNGMKGDSIFFVISEDGKKLEELTFKGYWRCSGKLEQTMVGPEGFFEVANGKVNGRLTEPPDGGSTAWRFEVQATITETNAEGTFRMNINNLGCDTYKLNFTAVPQ